MSVIKNKDILFNILTSVPRVPFCKSGQSNYYKADNSSWKTPWCRWSSVHTARAVAVAAPVPLRRRFLSPRVHPLTLQRRLRGRRQWRWYFFLPITMISQSSALGEGSVRKQQRSGFSFFFFFPPLSDGRPSPVEKWVPWLLKGPTCQRSGGISHSQSPYCSPGHNGLHGGLALCHRLCCELLLGQQKCNTPVTMD